VVNSKEIYPAYLFLHIGNEFIHVSVIDAIGAIETGLATSHLVGPVSNVESLLVRTLLRHFDNAILDCFINDLLLPLRVLIRKLGLGLNNRDSGSVNAAWLQTSSPHAPLATTSNSTNVTRYTTFRAF
jgi:hypothetical protein